MYPFLVTSVNRRANTKRPHTSTWHGFCCVWKMVLTSQRFVFSSILAQALGKISFQNTNPPSAQCQHEMLAHRQMMLTEFRMAPELVMHCSQEIDKWCSPRGDIEAEGRTLHCLMEHASVSAFSAGNSLRD